MRVFFPRMCVLAAQVQPKWRHSSIVHGSGQVTIRWAGAPDGVIGPLVRIDTYAEYNSEPLYTGADESGLVAGYRDRFYEAGDELLDSPGLVAGEIFYMPRFEGDSYLAWNGMAIPMLGRRVVRTTLDLEPHKDGDGFSATYLTHEREGLMAVHDHLCSRVYDKIVFYTFFHGRLVVCGMKDQWCAEDGAYQRQWYIENGDRLHGLQSEIYKAQLDETAEVAHLYTTPTGSARITVRLAA